MNTGNNTAGKTAPERYVSEKAFEELPDAFQKLAELLGEDQFELVAVNEKDSQDIYVQDGEIRLVYLMNDAVESFLVFGNARMTGVYKPDYEEEILADLSHQGREYILVVHQDDSVVTLFFETLTLEKHLYDYSQIGHFWVEGYPCGSWSTVWRSFVISMIILAVTAVMHWKRSFPHWWSFHL